MYISVGSDCKWNGLRYIHIRFVNQKADGFGSDLDKWIWIPYHIQLIGPD